MIRKTLGAVLLVAACAVSLPLPALADGDPASDFLLSQSTFLPYDASITKEQTDQLNALVAEAKKRGYTIRVAVIGKPFDLGSVPSLWAKPETYARFLGQELFFLYKGRLLVVMPNGFGVSRGGKALVPSQAVVDKLPQPGNGGSALVDAAEQAVQRLAAQSGVKLTVPAAKSTGGSTNRDRIILGAIAVGVVGLIGIGYALRRLVVRR
jgi:hypothetical protein